MKKIIKFLRVSCASAQTLYCELCTVRHCGEDQTLVEIISRHLEVRMYFEHEENDAGGHIANFMRRICNGRERGKKKIN